jgi:hypothetical protein
LFVLLGVLPMRRSFERELTPAQLAGAGVCWGLLLLAQPAAILVLIGWIVVLHLRSDASIRQILGLGLLPLLIVAPWVIRNFLVFHSFVFVRDNLGIVLATSNSPCSSALFNVNMETRCNDHPDPNYGYEEALRVRQYGEARYNRIRAAEAAQWIAANPRAFCPVDCGAFCGILVTAAFAQDVREWHREVMGALERHHSAALGALLLYPAWNPRHVPDLEGLAPRCLHPGIVAGTLPSSLLPSAIRDPLSFPDAVGEFPDGQLLCRRVGANDSGRVSLEDG